MPTLRKVGSAILGLGLLAVACSRSAAPPAHASKRIIRVFDYVTIDGQHLASETTRGRVTVILLMATYDMGSQIVARELSDIVRARRPRINAGAVVLEPPKNAPLAAGFADALELPFPLALADPATLEARGAFGEVHGVPTTVVLDEVGTEIWRAEGVVSSADIERAITDAVRQR